MFSFSAENLVGMFPKDSKKMQATITHKGISWEPNSAKKSASNKQIFSSSESSYL
jgi:hypothetical protein